jgi:two-component system NtrC family response regulator
LPLARLFINDFSRKSGRSVAATDFALCVLERAEWRGNIRELRSFVQNACLDALFAADLQASPGGKVQAVELTAELLLSRLSQFNAHTGAPQPLNGKTDAIAADYRQEIKNFDRLLIRQTLEKNNRNVSRTAVELGLSRYGLIKKIKRYGINIAD